MARRALASATALAACALLAAPGAFADPLAVLVAGAAGESPLRVSQRVELADAVAATLARGLPEVLSGAETRARLEVLDPTQLACAAAPCAAQVAALLRARGVVLVRWEMDGSRMRLELLTTDQSGAVTASQHGEATIADWADATALGRVVASQLLEALRPRPNGGGEGPRGGSGAGASQGGSAGPPPVLRWVYRPDAHPAEIALGGALMASGALAAAFAVWALATPPRCAEPDPGACTREPPPWMQAVPPVQYSVASPLNWAWVGVGAAAIVGGAFLIFDGATARTRVPVLVRPRPRARIELAPTAGGAAFSLRGVF